MNYWTNRRLSRRTMLRGSSLGAVGLASAALIGCGSDDTPTGTTAPAPGGTGTPTTGAPDPTTQPGGGNRGGVLRLSGGAADGTDIHTSTHVGAQTHAQYSLDGLWQLNEPTPGDFEMVPMLAESLEQPDDLTYIFKLRQGVKFHNVAPVNGREFTAEDAKFSLERQATDDPRYTRRSWLAPVTSYEVLDDYTLKLTTSSPAASLLYLLSNPWVGMISKEQADRDGDALNHYIGTGPYVNTRADLNNAFSYERHPDYWGDGAYFDRVELTTIPDEVARAAAFRAGEIYQTAIAADSVPNFERQNPNATLLRTPSAGIGIIAMNNRRAPYDDVRVRRAIALASDVPGWIDAIVGGEGFLTGPMAPPFRQWALQESDLRYHEQDLVEAKRLLDAAVPGGFTVKSLSIGNVPTYLASAVQMQADLRSIGIETEIDPATQNDYVTRLFVTHDYDVVNGQDFSPDDPDRLIDRLHSDGSGNYSGYSNADVDDLLTRQRSTIDLEERRELVVAAQKIIIEEVPNFYTFVPWAFTFTQNLSDWRESAITGNGTRWNARNAYFENL